MSALLQLFRRPLLALACLIVLASSASAVDLRGVLTGYTFTSWLRTR